MRSAPILLLALALPVLAATEPAEQQSITPITPPAEQRVEPIAPAGEQHVEVLSADGVEQVNGLGSRNPARQVADGVAKVVIAVVGAGVAIGSTIAALLFL